MAKYSEKLVEKIARLIEEDIYSISDICYHLRISRKSFYEWKTTKPEFAKVIEEAEDRRDDRLVQSARWALQKKVEGYTTEHITETYVPDKTHPNGERLVKRVVTKRHHKPDTKAIKLVLEREDAKREKRKDKGMHRPPMQIIVKDQETKDVLEKLRDQLQGKIPFPVPPSKNKEEQPLEANG